MPEFHRPQAAAQLLAAMLLLLLPMAQADQTLRVGTYALPRALGNPHSSTSISELYTWAAIFDNLTRVDGEGRVQPSLAVSWQALDSLTWRFRLREGVRFSNGEPFDGAAVAATISYITSEGAAGQSVAREFRGVKGARVIDRLTVEISTRVPMLVLPAKLAATAGPSSPACGRIRDRGQAAGRHPGRPRWPGSSAS